MEMPVQCRACGEWIELNDSRFCNSHECRGKEGMCRECFAEHEEWHDRKDNERYE